MTTTQNATTAERNITIDPEFRGIIPPLTEAERNELEASILREGCRDPLATWRGILLDGHNRYEICQQHGIDFRTEGVKLRDRDAAQAWMIRNQFARRNLAPYQRAELALQLEPLIAKRAKANQKAGGAKAAGNGKVVRKKSSEPLETREELAKVAGVSHDTIRKARFIAEHCDDKSKENLRSAKTSINQEFKWARKRQKER